MLNKKNVILFIYLNKEIEQINIKISTTFIVKKYSNQKIFSQNRQLKKKNVIIEKFLAQVIKTKKFKSI